MVYECWYTILILFGHICTSFDFMADVKPFFSIFYFMTLTDVFIKVTVADFIATFLADVIAIMCVRW